VDRALGGSASHCYKCCRHAGVRDGPKMSGWVLYSVNVGIDAVRVGPRTWRLVCPGGRLADRQPKQLPKQLIEGAGLSPYLVEASKSMAPQAERSAVLLSLFWGAADRVRQAGPGHSAAQLTAGAGAATPTWPRRS